MSIWPPPMVVCLVVTSREPNIGIRARVSVSCSGVCSWDRRAHPSHECSHHTLTVRARTWFMPMRLITLLFLLTIQATGPPLRTISFSIGLTTLLIPYMRATYWATHTLRSQTTHTGNVPEEKNKQDRDLVGLIVEGIDYALHMDNLAHLFSGKLPLDNGTVT